MSRQGGKCAAENGPFFFFLTLNVNLIYFDILHINMGNSRTSHILKTFERKKMCGE